MTRSSKQSAKPSPAPKFSSSENQYLATLNQYKEVALITFVAILGVSGVLAYRLAPPAGYTAKGLLTSNNPPVKFSTIGAAILKQGEKLGPEALLADNVVKAVADAVKVDPQQIRQNTGLQLSPPDQTLAIGVSYRADERQQALATADLLMKGMIEKSRLINQERWQVINQSITQRLTQVTQDLKQAEKNLDQSSGDERERTRLEDQVKLQQEIYDKTQSALADAKAAEKEVISSLTMAQVPQLTAWPGSNPTVPIILGTGLLLGLLTSGGLVPVVAGWQQQKTQRLQERQRLQAIFYQLLEENSGELTLTRFAVATQVPVEVAQRYLNKQAEAFNATCQVKEDGGILYRFHL